MSRSVLKDAPLNGLFWFRASADSTIEERACRESGPAVYVLDQDALYFLNRLRISLHRMGRIYDLLRFDAFNVRARILDDAVSPPGRRPPAVNADDGVGDHSIGDGDRG